MDDGGRYKLKISIDNTVSDIDDDSESGTDSRDDFRNTRRKNHDSNDEMPGDRDSDNEDALSVDPHRKKISEQKIKTYKNKAGSFVIGFDPTTQECIERQEQRAKRFGNATSGSALTDEVIQKLYDSLGVSVVSSTEEGGVLRLDAINIRGVDDMSTSRVFEYFAEFAPSAVEWIDDTSCNVVWIDRIMAARAMLKLSTEPESSFEDDTNSIKKAVGDEAASGDIAAEDVQVSSVSLNSKMAELTEVEDDDELNLLSDDDLAKLSCSTITAEENRGPSSSVL